MSKIIPCKGFADCNTQQCVDGDCMYDDLTIAHLKAELATVKEYILNRNLMSTSEFCSRYNYQDCSACEKESCGDNTNPIVAENKRLRDKIRCKQQWQKCPRCNKTFATDC